MSGDSAWRGLTRDRVAALSCARVQRTLITIGLLIALVGLLWPWITKLGLGRLPGDLRIDKPGFTLFAPFTTMLIVSVVLSLLIWLLRR
jgi:hypothetical protein